MAEHICIGKNIVSPCREQARSVYYGAVFEIKNGIPAKMELPANGRVEELPMPLRTTYAESRVHHDRWRDVYGRNPSQLRFDNEIYRWLSEKIQPGEYLVLCENDQRSFEAWLVMSLRRRLRRRSRVEATEGGLEFWPQGSPSIRPYGVTKKPAIVFSHERADRERRCSILARTGPLFFDLPTYI